ncbi:MAG TPA: ATP-binding protein, partial [Gemmatimonadaceae bacterium]|nr:ATP-binding protein [Gemmatimonadaceae bacterium]
EFTRSLRLTVSEALRDPVEFYQESLDFDRFDEIERSSALTSYFGEKYGGFPIDLIVPVGGRALGFAIDNLRSVFPGVPVVFALSAAPQTNPGTLPPGVTGRLAGSSRFVPTFALARALQPDAERVVIVGGSSPADSNTVTSAVQAVHNALPVTTLQGLSLDTLLTRLHRLPKRSIVILANFRRDGLGQVFDPVDLVGTMARASSAPMYAQLRSYIGEGLVGGSALSFDEEGARTGDLIVRTLRRHPDEPMPPVEMIKHSSAVDARQLRRWKLDETRLPRGTDVLFREPSLWEQYRTTVLIGLGVISVEALLIGLLLVERQRRRRAQLAVQEQAAYEHTMAGLTTDAVRHVPDDAPRALEDALARIGLYAGASIATLVQRPDNEVDEPLRLSWHAGENGHASESAPVENGLGSRSRLEIPLVADGTSIGRLELQRSDGHGWPAALIRRLDSAGEILASAMARSRAAREIHRGEELNRAVLASLSAQIAILDHRGTIIRVNDAWREVARDGGGGGGGGGGVIRGAFVGANYLDECRRAELRGCGDARDVREGIEAVLERRSWPFRREYRSREPDERWFEVYVDCLQVSEGGAIVTHFDVTDRRLAERRAEETRRQVAHMARMAFVGELAATISHELRQPLAAIRVNAEAGVHLLAGTPGDVAEAREVFRSIVADDARAVELIEGVRKLLRKEESTTTTVDLNEICRDAARLLQHDAVLRNTRLELSLAEEPPLVTGDPVQLEQVVLNLALNGLEATSTILPPSERCVVIRTEPGPDYAEVLVRDSGTGIPIDVQPHLFESFFSTKTEGLGLGLVIVRSIVERHNGRILVENQPLGGALFRVRLPMFTVAPAASRAAISSRTEK